MFCKHRPNPDKPVGVKRKSRCVGEPKKKKDQHESTKKNKIDFVLSKFRVFVMKILYGVPLEPGVVTESRGQMCFSQSNADKESLGTPIKL